uniref:G-patch domain-containing protein n=1 Tax=Panagrellus redivivus TaxID=6233 RepID=A0A7E4UZ84_PANRE
MDPAATDDTQKVGFKSFTITNSRKRPAVINNGALSNAASDSEDEGFPQHKKEKRSDNGKPKKDDKKNPLVIPRIVDNDWRVKHLREKEAQGKLTDEERARLELLDNAVSENGGQVISAASVSDSNATPDNPDYNQVPIASFGMALLRGYGYNENEGIGKTNKSVVQPTMQKKRVKNLGLGATLPDNGENMFDFTVGAKVVVDQGGKQAGEYGTVESVDSDNVACVVRMALSQKQLKISQLHLKIVTKKEFDSQAMVLNRKTYDAAKKESEIVAEPVKREINDAIDVKPVVSSTSSTKYSKVKKERSPSPVFRNWVMENLRVRIIKKGNLYKEKMVVVEASSSDNILLRDEKRAVHEVKESDIETVIPRGVNGKVLVVTGKYKGCVGVVYARDNDRYILWIRLVETDEEVKVDFDDACEYVGFVPALGY